MPLYSYCNPENENEIVSIVQGMNDEHIYSVDGVKWNRIYYVPQAAVVTKLDPFNKNQFIEKTGNSKGSMGDLLDRSKELSQERERIMGIDPLKEKAKKDWSAERKGKRHPSEIEKSKKVEISFD